MRPHNNSIAYTTTPQCRTQKITTNTANAVTLPIACSRVHVVHAGQGLAHAITVGEGSAPTAATDPRVDGDATEIRTNVSTEDDTWIRSTTNRATITHLSIFTALAATLEINVYFNCFP